MRVTGLVFRLVFCFCKCVICRFSELRNVFWFVLVFYAFIMKVCVNVFGILGRILIVFVLKGWSVERGCDD